VFGRHPFDVFGVFAEETTAFGEFVNPLVYTVGVAQTDRKPWRRWGARSSSGVYRGTKALAPQCPWLVL